MHDVHSTADLNKIITFLRTLTHYNTNPYNYSLLYKRTQSKDKRRAHYCNTKAIQAIPAITHVSAG